MDCNTIFDCSSSTYNSNRSKKLKNTDNITDALPKDIMMLILNKLDLVDFHRISVVCKSWQSISIAAKKIRPQLHLQPEPPWLIFSSLKDDHIMCFSLSQGKVFRLKLPDEVVDVGGALCCGSNCGCLIMLCKMGHTFLWNPFTKFLHKATLPYPQLDTGGFGINPKYIRKVMLLLPPQVPTTTTTIINSNYLDISIYCSGHLAFRRPGAATWSQFGNYDRIEDIIFHNGKFYGIDSRCDLKVMELDPHPKVTSCNIASPIGEDLSLDIWGKNSYLVECLGELLLVVRFRDGTLPATNMFKIFKLDPKDRCWIKVEDLGDQMLFICSSTTSFSLSPLDYYFGFRGNSIYFTGITSPGNDSYFAGFHDMGVFHLEDNSIEPFYLNDSYSGAFKPIWFAPISW